MKQNSDGVEGAMFCTEVWEGNTEQGAAEQIFQGGLH